MKLFASTFIAISAFSSFASEINLYPTDIFMKCEKSTFTIRVPKIEILTQSRVDTFGLVNQNQAICLTLKDHLSKRERLKGIIKSSLSHVDTYIDNPTCSEESCYVTYKFYHLETVDLSLDGIPFKARNEVPGTSKLRKVYWNSNDCPPFKPDCDL